MNDYSSLSDETLVDLCRSNDESAWKELYSRYFSVSKALCKRFHFEGVENDDLIQEGMIGFLSAVHSYQIEKSVSFSAYAVTCMRNKIINIGKSSQKKSRVPQKLCSSLTESEEIIDAALTPEELMIYKTQKGLTQEIVFKKLSGLEQAVFKLYLCGMTYDEIADKLLISKKSVDGALQRARKKIRAELEV